MVYIDPETTCLPKGRYRWTKVTHLFADDEQELHRFAAAIGMRRSWFQTGRAGLPHYDLNPARRLAAVRLGATQLTREQAVAKWRAARGIRFGPEACLDTAASMLERISQKKVDATPRRVFNPRVTATTEQKISAPPAGKPDAGSPRSKNAPQPPADVAVREGRSNL